MSTFAFPFSQGDTKFNGYLVKHLNSYDKMKLTDFSMDFDKKPPYEYKIAGINF